VLRWPAEWEDHEATWLSWPRNLETWPPERLGRVEAAFVRMVAALTPGEAVRINVADERCEERARALLAASGVERGVEFFAIASNDAWVRDHGPLFVEQTSAPLEQTSPEPGSARLVALDFGFNAWGRKYPPWDLDDAVPGQIAGALGLHCERPGFVLEGGSVEGNGRGCLLTTESCLLNPNRSSRVGDARSREKMERRLARWLGARQVVWLADGIAGDDTDGHIDDLTRFVDAGTLVTVVEDDPRDANHGVLRDNRERLRSLRDMAGKPFSIVELPMPPAIRAAGQRLPASYANFYLANGVALVPVFSVGADERALAILRECLAPREVVPIPARDLVYGLGAVHCLTQQQPRLGASDSLGAPF